MHWLAAMSSRCALARVLPGKTLLSCKWHLDPRRCDRAARPDASVWQLNALQAWRHSSDTSSQTQFLLLLPCG